MTQSAPTRVVPGLEPPANSRTPRAPAQTPPSAASTARIPRRVRMPHGGRRPRGASITSDVAGAGQLDFLIAAAGSNEGVPTQPVSDTSTVTPSGPVYFTSTFA